MATPKREWSGNLEIEKMGMEVFWPQFCPKKVFGCDRKDTVNKYVL